MSKHRIRKSRRYGDRSAYFEELYGKIKRDAEPGYHLVTVDGRLVARKAITAGAAIRASLDDNGVNLTREFIPYVAQNHPGDERDIAHLVNVNMKIIQGKYAGVK